MVFNATANRQIDDNIKTDLILKEGADVIPKLVKPDIQPVYEVYRRVCNISRTLIKTDTGAANVLAAASDRDISITAVSLSLAKDATCNVATGAIEVTATVRGVTTALCGIAVLTTTAERDSISVSFPAPVMIDRGTAVAVSGTFTLGAMTRSITVHGYSNSPSQPPFLSTN